MKTEKREITFVQIETTGFQDLCNRIAELEAENESLRAENKALKKEHDDFYENEYLRRIDECNRLWGELFDIKHMSMFEFAAKYCNDEENAKAGRAFARSLGVGQ